MASHLLAWEAMRFGKRVRCSEFEMWGCLGPNPNKKHSWHGLTRFKIGFGGELIEYVGAYDLILSSMDYRIYKMADKLTDGRAEIAESLRLLQKAHRAKPGSFFLQIFFDAKADELVKIFTESFNDEKKRAYNILSDIDPANLNKYKTIIK